MQIEPPIHKTIQRIKANKKYERKEKICHVSPTTTATAADFPPANSPTMHTGLACQDRLFVRGTSLFTKNPKKQPDMATYRLNQPRGWFSENMGEHGVTHVT